MDWVVDWVAASAIATSITAFVTVVYTIMFGQAVFAAFKQLSELKKSGRFQATLAVFKELKARDFIEDRRYIYDNLPENTAGIEAVQLKSHFRNVEVALTAFERVGYLLREKHIDAEPILENYWASVWRCWKKSKNLIAWAREQRGQQDYFRNFEYLFSLSEEYRIKNKYEEPKFY